MNRPEKFKDTEETIHNFSDEFLVECPQCGSLARVISSNKENIRPWLFTPRRVICTNCSYLNFWNGNRICIDDAIAYDWYFRLPLWLQINCCGHGHILWAYNERHLNLLEEYIGSRLRERKRYRRGTLASCLPTWMKEAKNRDELLKCIGRLRAKLKQV